MSKNKDYITLMIMFIAGISLMLVACLSSTVTGIVAFALFIVGAAITGDTYDTLLDSIKKNNERENHE